MLTEGEILQFSVLPYRCSICPPLVTRQMSNLAVLADSKTQNASLFPVHAMFRHDCPRTVKLASTQCNLANKKKNLERFCTYWYVPFCCACLGCCAAEFGSSGGTYELPCIYLYLFIYCPLFISSFLYSTTWNEIKNSTPVSALGSFSYYFISVRQIHIKLEDMMTHCFKAVIQNRSKCFFWGGG